MSAVWFNGSFIEEEAAFVPLRDTGLLHAAGVFTTMRSAAGRVVRIEQHLKRLRDSCDALSIPLPYTDIDLTSVADELLRQNELREARLRLTVTRGSAMQDSQGGMRLEPTVFITAAPFEPYPAEYYLKGLTVLVLDEQKLNPYDFQAGHKTLNYFTRLHALRDATQKGAGEAMWFNVHNFLQSGCISNVFLVKDEMILTPPTQEDLSDPAIKESCPYTRSNVLPGVTRAAVIEDAATLDIAVQRKALTISDLLEADEIFVTNSVMGVMPVVRIERKPVGDEQPGRLTREFMTGWNDSIDSA